MVSLVLAIAAAVGTAVAISRADEATSQPATRPAEIIVSLTENAAKEVKAIVATQNFRRYWLRIGVKADNETKKFSYILDVVEDVPSAENDEVYESCGVPIVVDHKSALYLMGSVVDFRDDANGKGFVFRNPNAVKE